MSKQKPSLKGFFRKLAIKMTDVFFRINPRLHNIEKFHLRVSEAINEDREEIDNLRKAANEDREEIDNLRKAANEDREEIDNLRKAANEDREEIDNLRKAANEDREKIIFLQSFKENDTNELYIRKKLDELPEIDYLKFENKFRGTEQLIKDRQKPYLKYFEGYQKVLDIGCGRGEFMEIAKAQNIATQGIDIDRDMVEFCKGKGLDVIHGDIFPFLLEMEDNSLDGVFSSQVIEHIPFLRLQKLIYLLQKKVKKGRKIVLETVNPLCPLALQHFYMDLTHIKPIFPDILTFIGESYDLKKVDVVFRTPIKEDLEDFRTTDERSYDYGDYAIVFEK